MTNRVAQLTALGQSIWYDNIQRRLLENGELAAMVARGEIRGLTSNPTIFNHAIARSHDYETALTSLAWAGWETESIFWQLAIEDIRLACDVLRPLYEETRGEDGFVSLEVSPFHARNPEATLEQARLLWQRVDRPNLMLKIPATREGLEAIRTALAAGLNVNVTLIFSLERYQQVMEAYLAGLEDFLAQGEGTGPLPASVASFFISRIDTKIDARLPQDSPLRGKAAIASAKLAYQAFLQTFRGPRWERLAAAGARYQRPLWASTSTKNPEYPDTLYVDNLIGPHTVNTLPPQTLTAFLDHGVAAPTLTAGIEEARRVIAELEAHGISLEEVTEELETEGLQAFTQAFTDTLTTIEARRTAALESLGPLVMASRERIARLAASSLALRIWQGDAGLWTDNPQGQQEIRRRLGWLTLPDVARQRLNELLALADQIHEAGIRKFLLLGMGGSSLAPEVFSLIFPHPEYQFAILDSTDPAQVRQAALDFPPAETLYLVASKSGGTVEVSAMLDYFWHLAQGDGQRFLAITDPGTSLEELGRARGFRHVLLGEPTVGGRFSALTPFGLLPAALLGIDIGRLIERAAWMMRQCRPDSEAARNPALTLGSVLGEAVLQGRDKLTILADEPFTAFGAWLEQLIAESSGKDGRGLIVLNAEPRREPSEYSKDRIFVYLRVRGDHDALCQTLRELGHPVLIYPLTDPYEIGAECYRWEFATAVLCSILGINAFDQPDVQDSKDRTKAKLATYRQSGSMEEDQPCWEQEGIRAFSPLALEGADLAALLTSFANLARPGDYLAINAYLPRNAAMQEALTEFQRRLGERSRCATTLGFGPRFLHSTGQLHKGGPPTGLFLQITADPEDDLEIPGQGLTFGLLERAQALGDYEALVGRGRQILRLHLPSPRALERLLQALS